METIKNERLLSLDILRGLTIILMIIVNTPGSWDHVYTPFLHAEWNGVTPTDYIFPTFLFIVGVSIVLSFTKQLALWNKLNELKKKFYKQNKFLHNIEKISQLKIFTIPLKI